VQRDARQKEEAEEEKGARESQVDEERIKGED